MNIKQTAVAAFGAFLCASVYSCSIYNAEVERQETERMRICVNGGGLWRTAWNWKTYCTPKGENR